MKHIKILTISKKEGPAPGADTWLAQKIDDLFAKLLKPVN